MRRRDQLAIVRELALDEAGGQTSGTDLERRIAIAEAHRYLLAAAHQALQLVEGAPGDQHLLVDSQHLLANEVAYCESVRVGGHHAQAVTLGGHHHTGEDRPRLVGARCTHHLAQRITELRRRQRHGRVDRRGQLGIVVEAQWTHGEVGAPVADRHIVAVGNDIDLSLTQ